MNEINSLTEEQIIERELYRAELIRQKDIKVEEIKETLINAINQVNEKTLIRYSGACEHHYSQFTQVEILQMILERFGLGYFQLEKDEKLIDTTDMYKKKP